MNPHSNNKTSNKCPSDITQPEFGHGSSKLPALLVPLVELSPTDQTSDAVLADLTGFLEGIGKVPVACKASPGCSESLPINAP